MAARAETEVVVGVGACGFGGVPTVSIATYALGSCIAVMAWDWKLRIGGLLHAMLPDSAIDLSRAASEPFVYVDTGIPEMFRRLEQKGASKRRMRCCVAGGASMVLDPVRFEIGKRNYLAARKAFWKLGAFIDQEDVGGVETRSLRLDLATGQIDMRKGIAPGRVFVPPGIGFGRGDTDAGTAR
jgi:chemotaxis protein CheD